MTNQNEQTVKVKFKATMGLFSSYFTKSISEYGVSNSQWFEMTYLQQCQAILHYYLRKQDSNIQITELETLQK